MESLAEVSLMEMKKLKETVKEDDTQSVGSSSTASSNGGGVGGDGIARGRFSDEEQEILVNLIKNDADLCRSFLHRLRSRQYDKKSWMHEISLRFNKLSKTKRSLDGVRHHLLIRKNGKDNYSQLIWHAMRCTKKRSSCTKCLLLDRFRIEAGQAKCGFESCRICKADLPQVFDDFSPHDLLEKTRAAKNASSSSNTTPPTNQQKPSLDTTRQTSATLPSLPVTSPAVKSLATPMLLSSLLPGEEVNAASPSSLEQSILLLQQQQLLNQLLSLQQPKKQSETPTLDIQSILGANLGSLTGNVTPHPQMLSFAAAAAVEPSSTKRKASELLLGNSQQQNNNKRLNTAFLL